MTLQRVQKSFRRAFRFLTEHEKVLLAILAIIIVISGGFWYRQFTNSHSDTPTVGGTYVEGVVADKNELSQLTTRLTKAGILAFSDNGSLQGQLADNWSFNPEQTEFHFTLAKGIDRQSIISTLGSRADVIGDVSIEPDQTNQGVIIRLSDPNPSFPLLMVRPIFDFGPYKLNQANDQTTVFTRSTQAHAVPAYLNKIVIHSYATQADLQKALSSNKIDGAISTEDPHLKNWQHFPVNLSRYYAVIFNTNKAPFRDSTLRVQLATNAAASATPFTLIAADQEPYKSQANDLVVKWKALGANVTLSLKPLIDVTGAISQTRNFQAIFVGIDYGSELDPYYLWHSSQVRATGNNISGINNTTIDSMISKVRTTLDPTARQQLLDSLHQTLTAQGVVTIVKQENFDYYISDKIHYIPPILPSSNADRFLSIALWSAK